MDLFSKITVAHFVWYLVPGLAFLFAVIVPFVIIDAHLAKQLVDGLGPAGIVLISIIMGFALDGLRLYRFRSGYLDVKKDFFQKLKEMIDMDLDPYLIQSHVSEIAREKEVTGIGFHHAIWIMHGHFAALSFLESFFWGMYGFYIAVGNKQTVMVLTYILPKDLAAGFYALFTVLLCVIGHRFQTISIQDQETTNRMFLDFGARHKDEIRKRLNA